MSAIAISQYGGPEVLKETIAPMPIPADDAVVIAVAYAGVNRPDCLQRMGRYAPPADASPYPGLEVSGHIVACGKAVSHWKIGDAVTALTHGGGYAEFTMAPSAHCLPIPEALTLAEAASLPENYFTVYSMLFMRAQLKPLESLLVHGGSSGIGTTAIQMARLFGIEVYTTAGSDEKCQYCRQQGAKLAINYRQNDWAQELMQHTNGVGVDVILDMVGGSYINKGLKLLKPEGRYIFLAFLEGAETKVNFLPVMTKRLTLTGATLRPQSQTAKSQIATALQANIWPFLETGQLKPVVHKIFDLKEAHAAHSLMESSLHMGKILLKTDRKT